MIYDFSNHSGTGSKIKILAEWIERLAVNAKVATVLGSIPTSSDTAESEGRQQMKQCWIRDNKKKKKIHLVKKFIIGMQRDSTTVPYKSPYGI